jgi:hypothetical protein
MSRTFLDIQTELPKRIGEVVHVESLGIADRTQRQLNNFARMKEIWGAVNAKYVQLLDRSVNR